MPDWQNLAGWQKLTSNDAADKSRTLVGSVYPQSQFLGVGEGHYANSTTHVAMFDIQHHRLAFIPGFTGLLGTELNDFQYLFSLPKESEEWQGLVNVLTPLRTVTIAPFLLQMVPSRLEKRQYFPDGRSIGTGEPIRRTEVVVTLQREGFRLPSSDEWEYACGAGSRTLFRWGNEIPPFDWKPLQLREQDAWREDAIPNAFGLTIANDPFEIEYCAEPHIVRGGDGGTIASIGARSIETWLPLASAYLWSVTEPFVEILRRPSLRRVLSLY